VNEEEKLVQHFVLAQWNEKQEAIFKAGGVALPRCNTYEELKLLHEILGKIKISTTSFKEMENQATGEIIFDLPYRYKEKQ
jgi:hypothetical protein